MIDGGTTVHVNMEVVTPVLTGIFQVCIVTCARCGLGCYVNMEVTIIPVYNPGTSMYSY